MLDINKNSQICDMIAEGEVATILSNLNNDYIISVIKSKIDERYTSNNLITNPNIILSYEMNFKDLLERYPSDRENILRIRYEIYKEIIDLLCNSFNLKFVIPDDEDETKNYTYAYYLYDFLVSNFMKNIVNFFANYIYNNMDSIYNNMDLSRFKKDKDASTLYVKRAFKDTKIAVIISKLKEVLYYISAFDIDMDTVLMYNYDKFTSDFITSIIIPYNNFFKENYCKIIDYPNIITDIRLLIHNIAIQNMDINNIRPYVVEDNIKGE